MRQRQSNYVLAGLNRWRALIYAFFVLGLLPAYTWAQDAPESVPFESLTTYEGTTYSNVTITLQTKTHISINHADGMATVKMSMLPPEEQAKIGYTPPPPPKSMLEYMKEIRSDIASSLAQQLNDPRLQTLNHQIRREIDRLASDKVLLYTVVGGVACIYILFCLAAVKICRKTMVHPGLWVWLPVLQWIPLLKAAGMSPWNFLWLLIPPINLVVMVVWCFKICRTRHKSSALGFLLLLPVINIPAYFYLAFSSQKYPAAHAQA